MSNTETIRLIHKMRKGYPRFVDIWKLADLIDYAIKSGERHQWQLDISGDEITILALIDNVDLPDMETEYEHSAGVVLTYHAIDRAIERHHHKYIRETGRRIGFTDWLAARADAAYRNGCLGIRGRYHSHGIQFAFTHHKSGAPLLKTVV